MRRKLGRVMYPEGKFNAQGLVSIRDRKHFKVFGE